MFDDLQMKVVVNHEQQYSIWPADRDNPLGWNDAGKVGSKGECLAYIEQAWTDMRPLSLRRSMAQLRTSRTSSDKEK
ncbi:MbtH family protein [Sinorhizobium meliloti]|uniref:MbtH family protein n=1 Tax=Sinorhizobium TaxID=28105 RepID=UPI000365E2FB|nr:MULTISPECIES: MbtH family protein [Sinorhizobium]ARS66232.1 MbtH family protein [Sinorhizobium meliloti RU11/001]MDE3765489.1 MbtH family protein [Sinorhizobium meliloti]MDE3779269.1 MbtH family protein [Sinorhizobium meliloti]MDE3804774.1 MbtH family protein [Sinorhizobium meliloti]RVG61653.1 MbtH family protein [Sinorhizobium meliloti]